MKHIQAVLLLIHPVFSSKLMITGLNFFENPLLIRFQTVRNFTFDPIRTVEGGSKVEFRIIHGHVIDKLFEFSFLIYLNWFELDQKWNFEQFESGSKVDFRTNGSKVRRHAYASRDYLLHMQNWIKMYTPAYQVT